MIRFEEVTFRRGMETILKGLSLSVEAGKISVLAGENGAGKSTVCRLAAALLLPDSGRVLIDGLDAAKERRSRFPRIAGFLFQNPDRQLCMPTPAEELRFSLAALSMTEQGDEVRALRLLERVGVEPRARTLGLCRGARQMTALASLLIRRPKLLILDEPTSGLDLAQYEAVRALLMEERERGAAILMVTHDMELAESCADEMILLKDGAAAARGSVREVIERSVKSGGPLRRTEMGEVGALLGGRFSLAVTPAEMAAVAKESSERSVA